MKMYCTHTASLSAVLFYCLLLLQGTLRCHCNPCANKAYNYRFLQSNIANMKRNVFYSRGWGAAGSPSNNNLFLPSPMQLQYQHQQEPQQQQQQQLYHQEINYQHLRPIQELRRSANTDDEEFLSPIAEYLIQRPEPLTASEEDPATTAQSAHHSDTSSKNYHVIPQLFVSYGWGPIGK